MIPKEIDGVPITKPYGLRERGYIKGWEARQGEVDRLKRKLRKCICPECGFGFKYPAKRNKPDYGTGVCSEPPTPC